MTSEEVKKQIQLSPTLMREIGKFLKGIALTSRKKRLPSVDVAHIMSNEKGGVSLNEAEAKTYQSLVEKLEMIYPHTKTYNKSYAEKVMREAVISCAYPEADPIAGYKQALSELSAKYSIPLSNWTVFIPVSGFSLHKRTSWEFADITFVKVTNKKFKDELLSSWKGSAIHIDLRGFSYFIKTTVEAADSHAAVKLARERIELHTTVLDALSVIAGSTKPKETFSSYMAVGESRHAWAIAQQGTGHGWSRCKTVAMGGFSPHVLGNSQFIKCFHWRHVRRQMMNPDNTLFKERILPALKWLGRAAFQNSDEEIFLYYCLALEALYFDTKHENGLMTELKTRFYKLQFTNTSWLGSTVPAFNRFDYLYDLRSRIVHRGGVDISHNDLQLVRSLVIGTLYKLLNHRRFRQLQDSKDFEEWLRSGRNK